MIGEKSLDARTASEVIAGRVHLALGRNRSAGF
jgi:hypothetical protein